MATLVEPDRRKVPLEGAFNLRDMGGYATQSGGTVRYGMLYRSGTMAYLTEADERHLATLGIATICDLRRLNERRREPTRWHEAAGVDYWSRDYNETSGILSEIVRIGEGLTSGGLRQTMIDLYLEIPTDHAPSYRVMFERLQEGKPLLFNCAAGKDRTGVAAALILHVLGVPRETILEDYLLTNEHADFTGWLKRVDPRISAVAATSPDALVPLYRADADYLAAMYGELDRRHGGIDSYLAGELGVDDAARARLQTVLVA